MMQLRMLVGGVLRAVIRALFLPIFLLVDIRNARLVKRAGDVLETRPLRDATGGTFCVLHIYQRHALPENLKGLIDALSRRGIQIILVHNLPIAEQVDRAFLAERCHTIISRRNIGRDFGGYRTGILHALSNCRPDRLLVLNDSVFYIRRGLESFLDGLCSDAEFVGAAENYEFAFHVGSYALAFGPRILSHPRFRRFWEKYRLTNLRPAVIRRGELALNRLLLGPINAKPHVIYGPGRLRQALEGCDTLNLLATARQMPASFGRRGQLIGMAHRLQQWVEPGSEKTVIRTPKPMLAPIAELLGVTPAALAGELSVTLAEESRAAIMDFVVRGSQIHWGSLPLVRHLECPLVKCDLVLRSIYSAGDLGIFSGYMTAEEFSEFYGLLTARGVPDMHWSFKDRLLLSVGYL